MLIKTTDVAFHDNLNLSKYQSNYLIKNPIGKVFETLRFISRHFTFTFPLKLSIMLFHSCLPIKKEENYFPLLYNSKRIF